MSLAWSEEVREVFCLPQHGGQQEGHRQAGYGEHSLKQRPGGQGFFYFKLEEGLDEPEAGVV